MAGNAVKEAAFKARIDLQLEYEPETAVEKATTDKLKAAYANKEKAARRDALHHLEEGGGPHPVSVQPQQVLARIGALHVEDRLPLGGGGG